MGSYTTNLKLYKPVATEFVDVETQLNANWRIADQAVKRLLEYEFTPLSNPDVMNSVTPRSRFYKQSSNTIVTYLKPNSLWYQDPTAQVVGWTRTLSNFTEGWNFAPDNMTPYYRIIKKSGGTTAEVEWCGAFYELGGTMELNTNVMVIPIGGIPPEARPVVSKYFDVNAGNTATDFSMARILIGNDGRMEFKRYGVDPSAGNSQENRVELTGITYNIEIGA